jgi:hypothetical protein
LYRCHYSLVEQYYNQFCSPLQHLLLDSRCSVRKTIWKCLENSQLLHYCFHLKLETFLWCHPKTRPMQTHHLRLDFSPLFLHVWPEQRIVLLFASHFSLSIQIHLLHESQLVELWQAIPQSHPHLCCCVLNVGCRLL